jgi:nucleoside-diphosphate-sugar epimerase
MQGKRVLVTGASGCIGHYITEALIKNTSHELYLLVRNREKLQVDTGVRSGINVIEGDMAKIHLLADLLLTIDTAVLTATAWGGEQTFDVNVSKTLELIKMLDPVRCEQVIYFSTASVLDRHNQPLREAGAIGTDYIRSKYDCLQKLSQLEMGGKITKVFPTLVLGGDETKPYSHLTGGIAEVTRYINLIRFLQVDGSFHFIHGQDIATVVEYLIDSPPEGNQRREFVLGQRALTVNEAVAEVCAYLQKKIYFRIPLSLGLANLIIALFRIQMADWDRFCMNYRHFSYDHVINPGTWGLPNYCASMRDVLSIGGVKEGKV